MTDVQLNAVPKLTILNKIFTSIGQRFQLQCLQLYSDVLNFKDDHHHDITINEQLITQQNQQLSLYSVIEKYQFPESKQISISEKLQQQLQEISHDLKDLPKNYLIKPKRNINKTKLSKVHKNNKEKNSMNSSIEQNSIFQSKMQNQQKSIREIREKTLRKLELKYKLRSLNEQLQKSKLSILSPQENVSSPQINRESYFNSKTGASLIIIENSSFQTPSLKSKSDLQFIIKKKSLREMEQVYSPEKHEAAFKLIQKMHAEKVKKHEKILNEMKKKQEKELQIVKRLEQERKKQKQAKRQRQKLILQTPKANKSIKEDYQIFSESNSKKTRSNSDNLKQFMNSSALIKDLQRQESSLILTRKQKPSNKLPSNKPTSVSTMISTTKQSFQNNCKKIQSTLLINQTQNIKSLMRQQTIS